METILIKCPHCDEEMQAPAGRESIICMFCGKNIDLTSMVSVSKEDADSLLKNMGTDEIHNMFQHPEK